MRLPALTRPRPQPTPADPTLGPRRPARTSSLLNVAHRGASAAAPENTLGAIGLARGLGADLVEVDVQRSSDGVLVLMHDTTAARTTDVAAVLPRRAPWRVADLRSDELARLDAGSWRGPRWAGEPVPTLAAALAAVRDHGLGLQLELKAPHLHPGIVADLAEELGRTGGWARAAAASGRLVVQSFDVAAMKELKARLPDVPVAVLGTPPVDHLPVLAGWADQVNPRHLAVDGRYVEQVQALGMRCLVWTVDRPVLMRRALRMGVDGVITNRPDVLARLLAHDVTATIRSR